MRTLHVVEHSQGREPCVSCAGHVLKLIITHRGQKYYAANANHVLKVIAGYCQQAQGPRIPDNDRLLLPATEAVVDPIGKDFLLFAIYVIHKLTKDNLLGCPQG